MAPRFDKERAEVPLSRRLYTERSVAQELAASQKMLEKRFNNMLPEEPICRKPKKTNNKVQKKGSDSTSSSNNTKNSDNNNSNNNNKSDSKKHNSQSNNINNNNINNINSNYITFKNNNPNKNSRNNKSKSGPDCSMSYNFNYVRTPSKTKNTANTAVNKKNNANNNNNSHNANIASKTKTNAFRSKSASRVHSPRHQIGKIIIDRDLLTREQHLSILAAPKKRMSPRRRKKDKTMRF